MIKKFAAKNKNRTNSNPNIARFFIYIKIKKYNLIETSLFSHVHEFVRVKINKYEITNNTYLSRVRIRALLRKETMAEEVEKGKGSGFQ